MAKITKAEYDAMDWQDVESSNVARVAYKGTGKDAIEGHTIGELCVEFKTSPGRAYRYANVPELLHGDLLKSASIGGFFARNIRNRFEVEKLEADDDE